MANLSLACQAAIARSDLEITGSNLFCFDLFSPTLEYLRFVICKFLLDKYWPTVSDTVPVFYQSQSSFCLSKISTNLSCMQSFRQIRQNREFYDHFRVDDIIFTGILGKLKMVYHRRKSILIESFDIIDLLKLWSSIQNKKYV